MKYLYGDQWQMRAIKYLVEENKTDYLMYLTEDLFDSSELRQIFIYIKKKSLTFYRVPSFDMIVHECGGIFQKGDDLPESKQKILEKIKEIEEQEMIPEEMQTMIKDFIVSQELRDFSIRMNQNTISGIHDLQGYQREINRIASIDIEYKPGLWLSKYEIETKPLPERIPIHLPTVNIWTKGGLQRGELGFVFGQSGIGKTFMLTNIAVAGQKAHKWVFYYSFELSQENVISRIAQRVTGFTEEDIVSRPIKFRKRMDVRMAKRTDVYVKDMVSGSDTVNHIRADIDMVRSQTGISPDVIIVDYCDIVRPLQMVDDDWLNLGNVAVELRALGKQLVPKAAVWTASQIKGEYWDKDYSGKAGGRSVIKFDTADVVLGLMFIDPEDQERLLIKGLKFRRNKAPNVKMLCKIDRDKALMLDLGEYHEEKPPKLPKKT